LALAILNPFDDLADVQAIDRPTGGRVRLQASPSAADEAQRADPVASFGVSDADA
jgi:hypothetical protein